MILGVITGITTLATSIGGPLGVLAMIGGGLTYMRANNPKVREDGKTWGVAGAVGTAVVYGAPRIIETFRAWAGV
jgi:hypothetical protein